MSLKARAFALVLALPAALFVGNAASSPVNAEPAGSVWKCYPRFSNAPYTIMTATQRKNWDCLNGTIYIIDTYSGKTLYIVQGFCAAVDHRHGKSDAYILKHCG